MQRHFYARGGSHGRGGKQRRPHRRSELKFLVDKTQGSSDVVMFEFSEAPQARVPAAHFHREVDEVVYALDGVLTSTVDGKRHELRNGDSLFIPRGSVHIHENLHAEPARVLGVLTPGSIGRCYFEEVAAVVNAPGKPDNHAELRPRAGLSGSGGTRLPCVWACGQRGGAAAGPTSDRVRPMFPPGSSIRD